MFARDLIDVLKNLPDTEINVENESLKLVTAIRSGYARPQVFLYATTTPPDGLCENETIEWSADPEWESA